MEMKGFSREELNRIDEVVPERYGVSNKAMMENAGYQVAEFLRRKFPRDTNFLFCIGKGNNGGDGLIAARRMHQWGYDVETCLVTEAVNGVVREPDAVVKSGIEMVQCEDYESFPDQDVIVDGLIGLNLKGDPREPYADVIEKINSSESTVVSIDLPTGLDADTGEKLDPCIEPDFTVTLGLPNQGLSSERSGEIWLGDVSYPREIYEELGLVSGEIFDESSLVKLDEVK